MIVNGSVSGVGGVAKFETQGESAPDWLVQLWLYGIVDAPDLLDVFTNIYKNA